MLANKWAMYEQEISLMLLSDKEEEDDDGKGKSKSKTKIVPDHTSFDKHVRGQILDKLGLTKICCRRHMLGHVDFNN